MIGLTTPEHTATITLHLTFIYPRTRYIVSHAGSAWLKRGCPDENDIALDFYAPVNHILRPKRHWCLPAEITDVEYYCIRMRLVTKDKSGEKFPIAFYLDEDGAELGWSRFPMGRTIAILYPHQHGFLDLTVGIRQFLNLMKFT